MHDQIAIGDQCCQIEAGLIIDGRNVGRTVSATGAVQIDVHMGIDAARGQGHEISNRVVYGVVMTGQHVSNVDLIPLRSVEIPNDRCAAQGRCRLELERVGPRSAREVSRCSHLSLD
jgi:hypothetical protein